MWRNPKFWYTKPNFVEKILLTPFELVYSYLAKKNYNRPYRYALNNHQKVIAVGGMTVGGSGKTIVTQLIAEQLSREGKKVAVLSRGYGRESSEALRVDLKQHSYKDVGDEPLILAQYCSVFVGKNRYECAKLAGAQFDCFIMDDGFVQRYLQPDVFILVADGLQGFGNGHLLPLGPNRLKFSWVKNDINLVVAFNNFDVGFEPTIDLVFQKPKVEGAIVAFCGLGYPQKFFDTLSRCNLVKTVAFPDHYEYSETDIIELLKLKDMLSATLVTTEKDFIKIPPKYQEKISVIKPRFSSVPSIVGALKPCSF